MKKLLNLSLFFFATSAFAVLPHGGDSSAGGGGGTISMSSGFTEGRIDVSAFGSKDGTLGEVQKYYEAGGAQFKDTGVIQTWQVPGQEADHALIHGDELGTDSARYYQLNIRIKYLDLLQMRSSKTASTLEFRGDLADVLYAGMAKTGAPTSGQSLDSHNHVLGNIYATKQVYCQPHEAGTMCELRFYY